MRSGLPFWSLVLICLVTAPYSTNSADFYVAPSGNSDARGNRASPYDLKTALSGDVGHPGDTFWLREGIYQIGHIDTQIHGTENHPITFRQVPDERAQVVGSLTIWGTGSYVVFRDFELYSGDTNRLSKQTNKGFNPTDIAPRCGVQVYAPHCSFINLIVHDATASGFYTSTNASHTLIYGCIVFNCGWASADNAEGHCCYLQGPGEVDNNICFNATGAIFHIFSSGTDGYLRNITLDGNVGFGAGALQKVRPYRDWIVGVGSPADSIHAGKTASTQNPRTRRHADHPGHPPGPLMASDICLSNNMGFLTSNPMLLPQVQLGREALNGNLIVCNNYWPLGIIFKDWRTATVTGNLIAAQDSDPAVYLLETLAPLEATWGKNTYIAPSNKKPFRLNSSDEDFSQWQKETGWDTNSSCAGGKLTGLKVFVRPNRFQPGRANIVVYNWDKSATVSVDVSPVMVLGSRYEVRNAQDFYASPVASGIFDGRPLRLPMKALSVAPPMAPFPAPPPTGPTFNVFVLIPLE